MRLELLFTLFDYCSPLRKEAFHVSIFKDLKTFFEIEEKADLVFVPTLEDFPQAIEPFPQTVNTSETLLVSVVMPGISPRRPSVALPKCIEKYLPSDFNKSKQRAKYLNREIFRKIGVLKHHGLNTVEINTSYFDTIAKLGHKERPIFIHF